MKKIIIFVLSLVFSAQIFANPFQEGDTPFVVAYSGLNLRASPTGYGEVLDVIDFGEQVRIVEGELLESSSTKIGWVEGNWVKVEYDGYIGFVFDGFLNPMPLPIHSFEMCIEDMALIYPLESYMDYRFFSSTTPDTIVDNDYASVTKFYFEGYELRKENKEGFFKLTATIPGVRIMDVYHLLSSMLPGKPSRLTYLNESVFIADNDGHISQIKINLDDPVNIKRMKNGDIRVSIYTNDEGCSL